MKYLGFITLLTILFSCNNKQHKIEETTFSGQFINAQLKYLDRTINTYADASKTCETYRTENYFLDDETSKMKELLSEGKQISDEQTVNIVNHFYKICNGYGVENYDILSDPNKIKITTISDIELFRLYVKNYMVASLTNNKLMPKDIWTIMVSEDSKKIKDGQDYKIDLATIACNRQRKSEWFLVKENIDSPLTKENIIDTLSRDEDCIYQYKTNKYKKGKNELIFINRIPYRDYCLAKKVTFFVE